MRRPLAVASLLALVVLVPLATAAGRPDRGRWPANSRMVLIQNDADQSRPLDGRTGYSPFGGKAPASACNKKCESYLVPCRADTCEPGGRMWDARRRYLKLLGGHGNDDIHGGPFTDVLWGDFKPSGQPRSQVDTIDGGAGRDFIYGSAGRNTISRGHGRRLHRRPRSCAGRSTAARARTSSSSRRRHAPRRASRAARRSRAGRCGRAADAVTLP